MDALETAKTSTAEEDLTWSKQRDAINLTAKQILSRARPPRGVQSGVRVERKVGKEYGVGVREGGMEEIITANDKACVRPEWRGGFHFKQARCLPLLRVQKS